MNNIIKKDKKLLEAARKIFGDIIKTAYISTYENFAEEESPSFIERLKTNSKDIVLLEGKSLQIDNQTIYIEFKNNRLVGFTNSEWGSMFLQTEKLKRI